MGDRSPQAVPKPSPRPRRRAAGLGWVAAYDMAEYMHYDNALEGDLHAIIPGQ
jgi:hypothetical protein